MRIKDFFMVLCLLTIGASSCSGQQPDSTAQKNASQVEEKLNTTVPSPFHSNDVVGTPGDPVGKGLLNWSYINTFDSTIAFSKIAQLGKISVFILSTPWCGPCKVLKEKLSTHSEYAGRVDVYYINMSYGRTYNELKKTDAYFFSRMYDRLKEWPRVVVTSPSASIVKAFSSGDLYKECLERQLYTEVFSDAPNPALTIDEIKEAAKSFCNDVSVYQKTVDVVDRLLEYTDKFNRDKVITSAPMPE